MSKCCSDSLNNGQSSWAPHRQESPDLSDTMDSARMHLPVSTKQVPHYLGASTGSCHDLCKYGRHREERRKPLQEKWSKSSRNVLNSVEMDVSGKPKIKKIVKDDCCADPPRRQSLVVKTTKFNNDKMSLMDKHASSTSSKLSSSARLKLVKVKPPSASLDGVLLKGQRNSDKRTGRTVAASSVSTKKTLASLNAPLTTGLGKARQNGRPKLLPPLMHRMQGVETKASNCENFEKTLHMSSTRAENNRYLDASAIPAPTSSSLVSMSSPHSTSSLLPNKDAEVIKHCPNDTYNSASDNASPTKIDKAAPFRNQKVVTPQLVKNRPQRLRFRTPRNLGKADAADAGHPCPKIELKHHEQVQRKKVSQGLFNNVIEETANKLVLSRKSSKVKALVAAFEAVISLQEVA